MTRRDAITVKDIANMAGVSIGTVDRVLHERGRVAPQTAEKIRRIIDETGFIPNLHASNLAQSRTYRIGVLTPLAEQDSGFWQLPHEGMKKAAEELKPFNVTLLFCCFDRFSRTSFLEAGQKLMLQEPDGVLIAPVLPEAAEEFINSLSEKIPVCCFDSDLPKSRKLAFIGQDAYASGKLAAKLMKLMVPDGKRIAVIQAVRQDYHIRDRIAGFQSAFSRDECPSVYVEEQLEDKPTRNKFLLGILYQDPEIKGIFVSNDSSHLIAEYLRSSGKTGISLIGYDLIPENSRFLGTGDIDFILNQRPAEQGYLGIQTIFRALSGQPAGEKHIVMPLDILTAENVAFYPARHLM